MKDVENNLAIQILRQIPTPVMAVEPDFKIVFMNNAGCRLLDKSWES